MAEYREEEVASTGLLGHTLRLAAVVMVTGLAVVFWIDREKPPASPAAPVMRDVAPMPGSVSSRRSAASSDQAAGSEIVLRAGPHGHFMVDAAVNGTQLRFLVDTGASAIFLTPQDAERLGLSADRLTFSERYETANGEIRAAPVNLRSLRIGQLEFYDLPASVGESPGSISLLGMAFLKRFDSYQVRGDTLILSW